MKYTKVTPKNLEVGDSVWFEPTMEHGVVTNVSYVEDMFIVDWRGVKYSTSTESLSNPDGILFEDTKENLDDVLTEYIQAIFSSVKDQCKNTKEFNHYFKDVSHLDSIDVYRVLELFEVTHPCLQHAVKKILVAGNRGVKDDLKDVKEAIASLERYVEMQNEDSLCDMEEDKDNYDKI